jgi:hypothetical protein
MNVAVLLCADGSLLAHVAARPAPLHRHATRDSDLANARAEWAGSVCRVLPALLAFCPSLNALSVAGSTTFVHADDDVAVALSMGAPVDADDRVSSDADAEADATGRAARACAHIHQQVGHHFGAAVVAAAADARQLAQQQARSFTVQDVKQFRDGAAGGAGSAVPRNDALVGLTTALQAWIAELPFPAAHWPLSAALASPAGPAEPAALAAAVDVDDADSAWSDRLSPATQTSQSAAARAFAMPSADSAPDSMSLQLLQSVPLPTDRSGRGLGASGASPFAQLETDAALATMAVTPRAESTGTAGGAPADAAQPGATTPRQARTAASLANLARGGCAELSPLVPSLQTSRSAVRLPPIEPRATPSQQQFTYPHYSASGVAPVRPSTQRPVAAQSDTTAAFAGGDARGEPLLQVAPTIPLDASPSAAVTSNAAVQSSREPVPPAVGSGSRLDLGGGTAATNPRLARVRSRAALAGSLRIVVQNPLPEGDAADVPGITSSAADSSVAVAAAITA